MGRDGGRRVKVRGTAGAAAAAAGRDAKGTGGTAGAAAAVRREAHHSTVSMPRRGGRGRGGRREAYLLVVAAGVDGVGDVDGHRVGLVGVGSRVRGATTIWYSNLITHDETRPRFFGSSPETPRLLRIRLGRATGVESPLGPAISILAFEFWRTSSSPSARLSRRPCARARPASRPPVVVSRVLVSSARRITYLS